MTEALAVTRLSVSIGSAAILAGVDLTVEAATKACLVGSSGSGKSLTAAAIVGTLTPAARPEGHLRVAGHEVLGVPPYRRPSAARPAPIFQDAFTALNPVVRIGAQLGAVLGARRGLRGRRRRTAAWGLLAGVGFADPAEITRRYPSQLSGGQRQRVAAAVALACEASLVVADEPTTALDVVAQAEMLEVLGAVTRAPVPAAVLLITHDLLAACSWADVIHVLDAGRIVESGTPTELLALARHPATQQLVAAARWADESLPRPDAAFAGPRGRPVRATDATAVPVATAATAS